MKNIVLSLLFFASSLVSFGQSNDAYDKELARYIELNNLKTTMKLMLVNVYDQYVEQGVFVCSNVDGMSDEIAEAAMPYLTKATGSVMRNNFSLEELHKINEWLASPLGQKSLKIAPEAAQMGMSVMQDPNVLAKIEEIAAKYIGK